MDNLAHNSAKRPPGRRQAGFSLVDVMVGMLLGLIGTIIIFQVFEQSERVKRTTTGGGDAQQNGIAAVFSLERGLRQAGYGFNASDAASAAPPVPLAITQNPASNPDSLTIQYRPSNAAECPPAAVAPAAANNCPWEYGPFLGDTTFTQPPAPTTVYYCITSKAQLVSRFIPCGAPPAAPDPGDTLLVENISQLKVLPVMDATGTMVSLQLAVVARNSNPEKANAAGACDTTTAGPAWVGGQIDLSGMVGLTNDDWKCYRYKLFTVTVPLRNVLWR